MDSHDGQTAEIGQLFARREWIARLTSSFPNAFAYASHWLNVAVSIHPHVL
jgi:hypothetical protein